MAAKNKLLEARGVGEAKSGLGAWPVETSRGRFYAEREAQLLFFFQFLKVRGRWKQFLSVCPLVYRGSGERHYREAMAITGRWTIAQRWSLILTRILRPWLGGKWLPDLPEEAELALSG